MGQYWIESPIRWVEVEMSGERLVGVRFVRRGKMYNDLNHCTKVVVELDQFFSKKRREFEVEVEYRDGTKFQKRVWKEVAKIPFGETVTYKELAERVGSPRGYRAVAQACGANPVAIVVPCHRVVGSPSASSGLKRLGGYSGRVEIKKWLLKFEGVEV